MGHVAFRDVWKLSGDVLREGIFQDMLRVFPENSPLLDCIVIADNKEMEGMSSFIPKSNMDMFVCRIMSNTKSYGRMLIEQGLKEGSIILYNPKHPFGLQIDGTEDGIYLHWHVEVMNEQ